MSLSGEVRSWNWECFHRMKKNEIKTGRNKPPEVRTREQRIVRLTGCSSGWPLPQWLRW